MFNIFFFLFIILILIYINEKVQNMHQDFLDLAQKIDDATNTVAARIDRLVNSLRNSMTDEELVQVKAAFQAEIDKLTVLGQDPVNPVPTI